MHILVLCYNDKKHVFLFNAVSGTNYSDPEQLKIVTLENAIYMNMKNDLAFLIDDSINLYELQVVIININYGQNDELFQKCHGLWEYMTYVNKMRTYALEMDIEEAVERA